MNYNFVVYNAEDLEKVGEVVTNHSISLDDALDLLGAERPEKEYFDDPDLRINGQEYWSGDLRMELADDYVNTLIYAGHPDEYDTETLATFVRNAGTWDDPNVPECLAELADRADVSDEWEHADGDTFEDVIRKMQNILNVDLGI